MFQEDYKEKRISYSVEKNKWECEGKEFDSLSDARKSIDETEKKEKSFKLKKVDAIAGTKNFSSELTKVKVTKAVVDKYSYSSGNLISYWVVNEKGDRYKATNRPLKPNQELLMLQEAKKKLQKRIDELERKETFSHKELLLALGYPEEHIKSHFGIIC